MADRFFTRKFTTPLSSQEAETIPADLEIGYKNRTEGQSFENWQQQFDLAIRNRIATQVKRHPQEYSQNGLAPAQWHNVNELVEPYIYAKGKGFDADVEIQEAIFRIYSHRTYASESLRKGHFITNDRGRVQDEQNSETTGLAEETRRFTHISTQVLAEVIHAGRCGMDFTGYIEKNGIELPKPLVEIGQRHL